MKFEVIIKVIVKEKLLKKILNLKLLIMQKVPPQKYFTNMPQHRKKPV
jgi:hypothetical protein